MDKINLTVGVGDNHLKLMAFKAIWALRRCKDRVFVAEKKLSVQKVLKWCVSLGCYKKSCRVFLTYVFLVLVSMFSLSAQTPRKVSRTMSLIPLQIGDTIPQLL